MTDAGRSAVRGPDAPPRGGPSGPLLVGSTPGGRPALRRKIAVPERIRAAGVPDPPELREDPEAVIREALGLGSVLPPVRRLVAGVDGTMWLERVLGSATAEWVVLDADARPLFRTRLPGGTALAAASRDAVWATRTDELDVPYVVRYELVEQDALLSSR